MTWYYTREAGDEGQVLTDEGTPSGVSLSDLVRNGPLPMSVALELVAYLADVLTIAEEDKALHGDISPGDIFINDRAAVSLSGYGPARDRGRAPEGSPRFPASDVYGLGIIIHSVLSTQPMGAIPRERDAHDDAIVDKLLAIDWSPLQSLPGRDSLIHFLCSMLAFDPDERPKPLDVANVLSGAGHKIGGGGIGLWVSKRWSISRPIEEELPTMAEVLDAPAELGRVFNKPDQYARRQSASAKGECTAFWSRDKISAMLDEGEDPLAGSQMFQRMDLQNMLAEDQPSVIRSPRPELERSYPDEVPWSPDATITGKPDDPNLQAEMAKLRSEAELSRKPSAAAPPSAVAPAPPPGLRPSQPPPVAMVAPTSVSSVGPRAPVTKPFPWLPVVLGLVGTGLVVGLFVLAAVLYMAINAEEPAAPIKAQVEAEVVKEPPAAEPKKRRAAPRNRTQKKAKSKPRRRSARTAVEPLPSSDFEVTFRAMGAEALLECGDGQAGRFVGVTRRTFTDVTTCRVTIDGALGAVQVGRSSIVSCKVMDGSVACSGS